jgi:hypothetical protein
MTSESYRGEKMPVTGFQLASLLDVCEGIPQ